MTKIKKKGFTLIELLVVIAIIGILASMTLIATSSSKYRARDAKRQVDLKQIALAMEIYMSNNEEYIDTAAGPNTVLSIGSYLDSLPVDPINSGDHQYTWTDGTLNYYCIFVQAEIEENIWYCASNKRVWSKTQAAYVPSNADCCGVDVTN
ncbi:MAG: type II secretion system protein [Candidatus Nealsonbacteria bacterium]